MPAGVRWTRRQLEVPRATSSCIRWNLRPFTGASYSAHLSFSSDAFYLELWPGMIHRMKSGGLAATGPATQAELARSAEIEQLTMALTLRRMERDGIIYRVPDETDGRRAIVHLTSRAEALVPQIESIAENINSRAFDGMPAGSSAQLIDLLKRAATNLTQRPVD
jgi:MarR family transcriptional regulator for hemolysin